MRNEIPQNIQSVLNAIKTSISEISGVSSVCLKSEVKQFVCHNHVAYWNSSFDCLQVQCKFKDIVALERSSHVWNHMLRGLSTGRLSFLLRAGANCLPTPMNLHCWNYRVSNCCPLCQSPAAHIPNGYPEVLNQDNYTKRLFLLALLPRSSPDLMSQQICLLIFLEGKPTNLE